MGALCSKPTDHSGGHVVLSAGSNVSGSREATAGRPAGDRDARAAAAEARMKNVRI